MLKMLKKIFMRRKAKKLGLTYWGVSINYHKTCGSILKLGLDHRGALKYWCYKCNKIVEVEDEDMVYMEEDKN